MRFLIDLNCDMGEGMGNDAAIMPFVSTANIACGYHAGNAVTMQETVLKALEYGVNIGAHPSFPDRENFGRTNMYFTPTEVEDMVKKQIDTLSNIASKNNAPLNHVKPHGALYNMAAKDPVLAEAIGRAVLAINPRLVVMGLSGSVFIEIAEQMGLSVMHEVFADRTYQKDGSLTPRTQPNALLTTQAAVNEHVLNIVQRQVVYAGDTWIPVKADTICVHGDGAYAVVFAQTIAALVAHSTGENNY